jgi:hypothetical protein
MSRRARKPDPDYEVATDNVPFHRGRSQSRSRSVLTYYGAEKSFEVDLHPAFPREPERRDSCRLVHSEIPSSHDNREATPGSSEGKSKHSKDVFERVSDR